MARKRVSNSKAKQMICDVEDFRRNGCVPTYCIFDYHKGYFGYWTWLKSGWFFRFVNLGTVSIKAGDM